MINKMSSNIDSQDGIAASLPPGTNRYPYKGMQDMLNVVGDEQELFENDKEGRRSQVILFFNVDEQKYATEIPLHPEAKSICRSIDSYYPFAQILLVKMKTQAYDDAHEALTKILPMKLGRMNDAHLALH